MINSYVAIEGCTIDNTENKHRFPEDRINSIPYGFLNMNYESILDIGSTEVKGLKGVKATFVFSAGQSRVVMREGTSITDCTNKDIDMAVFITSPA